MSECNGCNSNCVGDCGWGCMQSGGTGCPDCEGYCEGTCENVCGGCGDSCKGDCSSTCISNCADSCKQGCQGSCTGECAGSCDKTSGTGESSKDLDTSVDSSDTLFSDEIFEQQYQMYAGFTDNKSITNDPKYSKIALLRGVSGMPYQFLPDTDRRMFSDDTKSTLTDSQYMGRTYIEKIAQRANILFLTPGKAEFLKGLSKKQKTTVLNGGLSTLYEGTAKALLADGESYRYYSFDFDVTNYYKYLNPMCRAAARYLKLDKYTIEGTEITEGNSVGLVPLTSADYSVLVNGGQKNPKTLFSNAYGALLYYLDGVSSSDDGINTSLGESSLVNSYIKDPTNFAQELKFLSGKAITSLSGSALADVVSDDSTVREGQAALEDFVKNYLNNNNLAKFVSIGATAVISGGQIIFPKIWNDTNWSTDSVSVRIKLISPDPDDLSIFFNVLVPMYSILCMAGPKGYIGIDGYSQPFMVRGFCQSMFNIEAGFITSLSMSKGGEGYWTKSGLPTSIDISLTIQDIYDSKYISTSEKPGSKETENIISVLWQNATHVLERTPFLKNTAMLNWIANSCGVNINKPDVIRDIEMYIEHSVVNVWGDMALNFSNNLNDTLRSYCTPWLNILGSQYQ